jgi:hypothetical protein
MIIPQPLLDGTYVSVSVEVCVAAVNVVQFVPKQLVGNHA